MSVQLRGKKYHYRFRLKEHRFSGVCENCTTEKDALKFEEQVYAEKLKEYEALQREKKRIRQNQLHTSPLFPEGRSQLLYLPELLHAHGFFHPYRMY